MRTTLDIPAPLIEEARHLLGFESKTETVILAFEELIRRRRIGELKSLSPPPSARSSWRSVAVLRGAGAEVMHALLDDDRVALVAPVRIELLFGARTGRPSASAGCSPHSFAGTPSDGI